MAKHLELLLELKWHGGMLVRPAKTDEVEYNELVRKGLVRAEGIANNNVRYELTQNGKRAIGWIEQASAKKNAKF